MFKEKLARVVRHVDGSLGCMLIGFDGIPIDSVFEGHQVPDLSAVAVEMSSLLAKFQRLEHYDMGEVNEVSVTLGAITALAHVVAEEYLLILAVDQRADLNQGKAMLRLIAPSVECEMV